MISQIIDIFLHVDVHLAALSSQMGLWIYVLLFLIIFAETGLVCFPFLPGDSLLFATGALVSIEGSGLSIYLMFFILCSAAFFGDNTNYLIGRWLGPQVFSRQRSFLLNPKHLQQAHQFYEEHGRKTVFLARFLPILRTFAPFVAGIGRMERKVFMLMSLTGSICWMIIFLGAGYLLGNIPWVKKNFSILIMGVVVVSLLPMFFGVLRSFMLQKRESV